MTTFFVHVKDNLFKCSLCHKIIKKTRGMGNFRLKQHYEIMHTIGNEVNCPICKQVIKNKYCLPRHISTKHRK